MRRRKVLSRSRGRVSTPRVCERAAPASRFVHVRDADNPVTEYHRVAWEIAHILSEKWFDNLVYGDPERGWLRIIISDRIRPNYRVTIKVVEDGIESRITLNAKMFRRHDPDLGDKAYGVIHVIVRALCEHYAKVCVRAVDIQMVEKEGSTNGSAFSASGSHAFAALADHVKSIKKRGRALFMETHTRTGGWHDLYHFMVRQIACHCSLEAPFGKAYTGEPVDAPYVIDRETLVVKRHDGPMVAPKLSVELGKHGVVVKLADADVFYATPVQ